MKKLREIVDLYSGYTLRNGVLIQSGNTKIVKIQNIQSGKSINILDLESIDDANIQAKKYIQKGDVLMAYKGSFKSGYLENDVSNILATGSIFVIRPNQKVVLPIYLCIFLNLASSQRFLEANQHTTTIKQITSKEILDLEVPLPSLHKQQEIIEMYELQQGLINKYEQKAVLTSQILETIINTQIHN